MSSSVHSPARAASSRRSSERGGSIARPARQRSGPAVLWRGHKQPLVARARLRRRSVRRPRPRIEVSLRRHPRVLPLHRHQQPAPPHPHPRLPRVQRARTQRSARRRRRRRQRRRDLHRARGGERGPPAPVWLGAGARRPRAEMRRDRGGCHAECRTRAPPSRLEHRRAARLVAGRAPVAPLQRRELRHCQRVARSRARARRQRRRAVEQQRESFAQQLAEHRRRGCARILNLRTRRVQLVRGRDETCPVSTGGRGEGESAAAATRALFRGRSCGCRLCGGALPASRPAVQAG